MGEFKDLTGMKFDKWIVIEFSGMNKNGTSTWLCQCNCVNKTMRVVIGVSLTSGLSTCCGCKIKRKQNRYDLSGNFGIGYTFKEQEFYFDLEDYEKLKKYCWCMDGNDGYVITRVNKKNIHLHRFLMNFPEVKIDHKNRKRNDCRKENLRLADDIQNSRNLSLAKNNKSGVTGVYFSQRDKSWVVNIKINPDTKTKNVGSYKNFDDAVHARLLAERKYFGEFSPQQHLFEQYGIPPL